jgi:hypothetical protein
MRQVYYRCNLGHNSSLQDLDNHNFLMLCEDVLQCTQCHAISFQIVLLEDSEDKDALR